MNKRIAPAPEKRLSSGTHYPKPKLKQPPDWETWGKYDSISFVEGLALLAGYEPPSRKVFNAVSDYPAELQALCEIASRDAWFSAEAAKANGALMVLPKSAFVAWAVKKEIQNIPEQMLGWLDNEIQVVGGQTQPDLVNLQEWVVKTSMELAEKDCNYIPTGDADDDLSTLKTIAAARENGFTENGCSWVGLWPRIKKMVGAGTITLFDSSGLMSADVENINFKNHKVWQISKADLIKLEQSLNLTHSPVASQAEVINRPEPAKKGNLTAAGKLIRAAFELHQKQTGVRAWAGDVAKIIHEWKSGSSEDWPDELTDALEQVSDSSLSGFKWYAKGKNSTKAKPCSQRAIKQQILRHFPLS